MDDLAYGVLSIEFLVLSPELELDTQDSTFKFRAKANFRLNTQNLTLKTPPIVLTSVQILSHRGQWLHADEPNTREAFTRSFRHGFGTETDIRDMVGHAVISHDPPTGHVQTLEEFLELHSRTGASLTLALNVKADGLQDLIAEALHRHNVQNYFLFDMSIPDMLGYLRRGLRCFTRQSDIEPEPALYEECDGVWIDTLRNEWLLRDYLLKPISDGKRAAIVSPELHGQQHLPLWEKLAAWEICSEERLLLCTDFPEEAKAFFTAHAIPSGQV